jgi:hypothetical protein
MEHQMVSSAVVIENVTIALTADQIIEAIRQLDQEDVERVRRELVFEEWREEFEQLLSRIRARVAHHPIAEEEVDQEVREVREARRARRLAQSGA